MKSHLPRMMIFGLFALVAQGSAFAAQMKTAMTSESTIVQNQAREALNPWPTVASSASRQPGTMLAHDDRDWHDERWHERRDDRRREDWRRDNWRREQARREAERRRDWERRHERAMQHRYEHDHRYYRR